MRIKLVRDLARPGIRLAAGTILDTDGAPGFFRCTEREASALVTTGAAAELLPPAPHRRPAPGERAGWRSE